MVAHADDKVLQIQVAPMIINSLPPTSRQPLVVRPFRPVAQAMTELPGLFGGKGKQRESTSDLDYALLEGLLVASSVSATTVDK